MYFDHSKRSYYRFPSQNSVTDFDSQEPMFFPDKHSELYNQYSDLYLDPTGHHKEDIQDRYS